jgi:hypothetical protein
MTASLTLKLSWDINVMTAGSGSVGAASPESASEAGVAGTLIGVQATTVNSTIVDVK